MKIRRVVIDRETDGQRDGQTGPTLKVIIDLLQLRKANIFLKFLKHQYMFVEYNYADIQNLLAWLVVSYAHSTWSMQNVKPC